MNKKMYDDLLNFDKNDPVKLQPNYFWNPTPNEGIKHYAKEFYNEEKPLKRVAFLCQKYKDKSLDISFFQREENIGKTYILGKDEYYIEVTLYSILPEEEQVNNNKFHVDDIIIKRIKSMSDIYNIVNLCKEFSYELGDDIFKTINVDDNTNGNGEPTLITRMIDILEDRENSSVGNEFLSESITFSTYNGLLFIYHEDDIKS